MRSQGTLRFLLYSHDGVGFGHVRRNLAVARALTELAPTAAVLLITGTDEANRLGIPANVEVLKLPGLRKVANDRYASRRLHIAAPDLLALRSALLLAAVQAFRPQVMLVDKHPLGAGGELLPALGALRAGGGRAALGLRDILDDRQAVLCEWAPHDLQARIAEHYDRVLVYGQRSVLDPIREYDFPAPVAARTHFCGYVLNGAEGGEWAGEHPLACAGEPRPRPLVLATPGGGEDGFVLLEAFVRAATGAPWAGVVVTGPMASCEERETLRRLAAEAGVALHVFVPGLSRWFGLVDALVCMGGYNTLIEAVYAGSPTVCVPRAVPRTEQLIRARAFARLGLLRALEPDQLDGRRLRLEVDAALRMSRAEVGARARSVLDCNGAGRAAGHLLELAEVAQDVAAAKVGGSG